MSLITTQISLGDEPPQNHDRKIWRQDFEVTFYVFCLMEAQWITILISFLNASLFHLRKKNSLTIWFKVRDLFTNGHYNFVK
jgi:hypothetical protein